ncbi:MAG: zf-HC2 domain-containing protein [Myxococcota bacterium]
MRHRAARRRLPQLLDRTLAPERERAVWAHVDQCRDCRERLAEFEACGRLLERLPAGLIPLAPTPAGEQRLAGLARWSPAPARGEGPETAALAVAAAALACVLVLAGARSTWVPLPDSVASAPIQMAYVLPGAVRAP